jgi:hypothetical protein
MPAFRTIAGGIYVEVQYAVSQRSAHVVVHLQHLVSETRVDVVLTAVCL